MRSIRLGREGLALNGRLRCAKQADVIAVAIQVDAEQRARKTKPDFFIPVVRQYNVPSIQMPVKQAMRRDALA